MIRHHRMLGAKTSCLRTFRPKSQSIFSSNPTVRQQCRILLRVQGLGFRVNGVGFGVQGSGCREQRTGHPRGHVAGVSQMVQG